MDRNLNYEQIIGYIYNIPRFTKKGGIEQTKHLMQLIGNPQENFKYIHIAGTNGKGSVSVMIADALKKSGLKIGLFTSPHLVKINERFQIDREMISDDEFVDLFYEIMALVEDDMKNGGVHPTFFELMYMMAMLWFKKSGVDVAVVETGLGGRLDATNVIENPSLTVITSIGFDHMQYLGHTMKQIASEKAGIIKENATLVYDGTDEEAASVIEEIANIKKSGSVISVIQNECEDITYSHDGMSYTYKDQKIELSMLGYYQIINSALAYSSLKVFCSENAITLSEESILKSLKETKWSGRMEEICPRVYVDGAHNDHGIMALTKTLKERFLDESIYLLFAVAEDKDYSKMISHLCELKNLEGVIVTVLDNERQTDMDIVASLFRKYQKEKNGHAKIIDEYNISEALQLARNISKDGILCCCGSLYLVGSIKEYLN